MKAAYQFLKKYGVSIGFTLGTVLSIIVILFIIGGFPTGATKEKLYETTIFNPAINVCLFLILVGTFAAFVGPIIYTSLNFKESVKTLVSIVVVITLGIVSIFMGATPSQEQLVFFQGVDNQHLTSKDIAFIDGLLIYTGIMIFLTLCSLVFMGVRGFIKQR
jgi:hypothetical protein